MTREEAIKAFEEIKASAQSNLGAKHAVGCDGYYRDRIELAEAALNALRPISREQVEKVWRTHWVSVDSGRVSRCAHCGFEALYPEIYTFCPDCGRPFTDYAVDILLKRFEVLKDGKKAD